MTTLFAVAFLVLFAGMLVLFALQPKLRHLRAGGPTALRLGRGNARSQLRTALMGDEAKVRRLVDYERRVNPGSSQQDAEQLAYQRWLRDQGR